MNINIYLEDYLARQLSTSAEKLHRKRNAIIREAIKEWLQKHTKKKWSKTILEFKGEEDFPDIMDWRQNMTQVKKDLF